MLKSSPYSISDLIKPLFGASLSILVLLYLTQLSHQLWIMAPFGATCVLLYAAAQSPLAQPKNVIVGHLVSAAIGLVFVHYLPINMITIALAVALAIVLMRLLGCVHPPAGESIVDFIECIFSALWLGFFNFSSTHRHSTFGGDCEIDSYLATAIHQILGARERCITLARMMMQKV